MSGDSSGVNPPGLQRHLRSRGPVEAVFGELPDSRAARRATRAAKLQANAALQPSPVGSPPSGETPGTTQLLPAVLFPVQTLNEQTLPGPSVLPFPVSTQEVPALQTLPPAVVLREPISTSATAETSSLLGAQPQLGTTLLQSERSSCSRDDPAEPLLRDITAALLQSERSSCIRVVEPAPNIPGRATPPQSERSSCAVGDSREPLPVGIAETPRSLSPVPSERVVVYPSPVPPSAARVAASQLRSVVNTPVRTPAATASPGVNRSRPTQVSGNPLFHSAASQQLWFRGTAPGSEVVGVPAYRGLSSSAGTFSSRREPPSPPSSDPGSSAATASAISTAVRAAAARIQSTCTSCPQVVTSSDNEEESWEIMSEEKSEKWRAVSVITPAVAIQLKTKVHSTTSDLVSKMHAKPEHILTVLYQHTLALLAPGSEPHKLFIRDMYKAMTKYCPKVTLVISIEDQLPADQVYGHRDQLATATRAVSKAASVRAGSIKAAEPRVHKVTPTPSLHALPADAAAVPRPAVPTPALSLSGDPVPSVRSTRLLTRAEANQHNAEVEATVMSMLPARQTPAEAMAQKYPTVPADNVAYEFMLALLVEQTDIATKQAFADAVAYRMENWYTGPYADELPPPPDDDPSSDSDDSITSSRSFRSMASTARSGSQWETSTDRVHRQDEPLTRLSRTPVRLIHGAVVPLYAWLEFVYLRVLICTISSSSAEMGQVFRSRKFREQPQHQQESLDAYLEEMSVGIAMVAETIALSECYQIVLDNLGEPLTRPTRALCVSVPHKRWDMTLIRTQALLCYDHAVRESVQSKHRPLVITHRKPADEARPRPGPGADSRPRIDNKPRYPNNGRFKGKSAALAQVAESGHVVAAGVAAPNNSGVGKNARVDHKGPKQPNQGASGAQRSPPADAGEKKCYHCNQLGHIKRDCKLWQDEQARYGAHAASGGRGGQRNTVAAAATQAAFAGFMAADRGFDEELDGYDCSVAHLAAEAGDPGWEEDSVRFTSGPGGGYSPCTMVCAHDQIKTACPASVHSSDEDGHVADAPPLLAAAPEALAVPPVPTAAPAPAVAPVPIQLSAAAVSPEDLTWVLEQLALDEPGAEFVPLSVALRRDRATRRAARQAAEPPASHGPERQPERQPERERQHARARATARNRPATAEVNAPTGLAGSLPHDPRSTIRVMLDMLEENQGACVILSRRANSASVIYMEMRLAVQANLDIHPNSLRFDMANMRYMELGLPGTPAEQLRTLDDYPSRTGPELTAMQEATADRLLPTHPEVDGMLHRAADICLLLGLRCSALAGAILRLRLALHEPQGVNAVHAHSEFCRMQHLIEGLPGTRLEQIAQLLTAPEDAPISVRRLLAQAYPPRVQRTYPPRGPRVAPDDDDAAPHYVAMLRHDVEPEAARRHQVRDWDQPSTTAAPYVLTADDVSSDDLPRTVAGAHALEPGEGEEVMVQRRGCFGLQLGTGTVPLGSQEQGTHHLCAGSQAGDDDGDVIQQAADDEGEAPSRPRAPSAAVAEGTDIMALLPSPYPEVEDEDEPVEPEDEDDLAGLPEPDGPYAALSSARIDAAAAVVGAGSQFGKLFVATRQRKSMTLWAGSTLRDFVRDGLKAHALRTRQDNAMQCEWELRRDAEGTAPRVVARRRRAVPIAAQAERELRDTLLSPPPAAKGRASEEDLQRDCDYWATLAVATLSKLCAVWEGTAASKSSTVATGESPSDQQLYDPGSSSESHDSGSDDTPAPPAQRTREPTPVGDEWVARAERREAAERKAAQVKQWDKSGARRQKPGPGTAAKAQKLRISISSRAGHGGAAGAKAASPAREGRCQPGPAPRAFRAQPGPIVAVPEGGWKGVPITGIGSARPGQGVVAAMESLKRKAAAAAKASPPKRRRASPTPSPLRGRASSTPSPRRGRASPSPSPQHRRASPAPRRRHAADVDPEPWEGDDSPVRPAARVASVGRASRTAGPSTGPGRMAQLIEHRGRTLIERIAERTNARRSMPAQHKAAVHEALAPFLALLTDPEDPALQNRGMQGAYAAVVQAGTSETYTLAARLLDDHQAQAGKRQSVPSPVRRATPVAGVARPAQPALTRNVPLSVPAGRLNTAAGRVLPHAQLGSIDAPAPAVITPDLATALLASMGSVHAELTQMRHQQSQAQSPQVQHQRGHGRGQSFRGGRDFRGGPWHGGAGQQRRGQHYPQPQHYEEPRPRWTPNVPEDTEDPYDKRARRHVNVVSLLFSLPLDMQEQEELAEVPPPDLAVNVMAQRVAHTAGQHVPLSFRQRAHATSQLVAGGERSEEPPAGTPPKPSPKPPPPNTRAVEQAAMQPAGSPTPAARQPAGQPSNWAEAMEALELIKSNTPVPQRQLQAALAVVVSKADESKALFEAERAAFMRELPPMDLTRLRNANLEWRQNNCSDAELAATLVKHVGKTLADTISLHINGEQVIPADVMRDAGCDTTMLDSLFAKARNLQWKACKSSIVMANGSPVKVLGSIRMRLTMCFGTDCEVHSVHTVFIMEGLNRLCTLLVGTPQELRHNIFIDHWSQALYYLPHAYPVPGRQWVDNQRFKAVPICSVREQNGEARNLINLLTEATREVCPPCPVLACCHLEQMADSDEEDLELPVLVPVPEQVWREFPQPAIPHAVPEVAAIVVEADARVRQVLGNQQLVVPRLEVLGNQVGTCAVFDYRAVGQHALSHELDDVEVDWSDTSVDGKVWHVPGSARARCMMPHPEYPCFLAPATPVPGRPTVSAAMLAASPSAQAEAPKAENRPGRRHRGRRGKRSKRSEPVVTPAPRSWVGRMVSKAAANLSNLVFKPVAAVSTWADDLRFQAKGERRKATRPERNRAVAKEEGKRCKTITQKHRLPGAFPYARFRFGWSTVPALLLFWLVASMFIMSTAVLAVTTPVLSVAAVAPDMLAVGPQATAWAAMLDAPEWLPDGYLQWMHEPDTYPGGMAHTFAVAAGMMDSMPEGQSCVLHATGYQKDEAGGWVWGHHGDATPEQFAALQKAVRDRKETAFAYSMNDLPGYKGAQGPFEIKLDNGDKPVYTGLRRYSPKEQEIANEKCGELRDAKLIERCEPAKHAAAMVIVPKKDEAGNWTSARVCFDYRNMNKATVPDRYGLHNPEDLVQGMLGKKFFSKLDLRSGFSQIPIDAAERNKTAFWWGNQLWQHTRMPFGMRNAPAKFQRIMDFELDTGGAGDCAKAFIDDVIIYSSTMEQHVKDVALVLDILTNCGLRAHPDKSLFGASCLEYLGHNVSAAGMSPNEAKVAAIQALRPPTNVSELRSVVGFMNYYRVYVPNFSQHAKPLTLLFGEKVTWQWERPQQEAFGKLKELLTKPGIVLRRFDPNARTVLHTDWSKNGIGAVLGQYGPDGQEYMVACISRSLNVHEANYSSYQGEMLACVWAMKTFRHYLHGTAFKVVTDHQPLQWLMETEGLTGKHARWALTIQDMEFTIEHRPGVKHQNADVPSRFPRSDDTDLTGARLDGPAMSPAGAARTPAARPTRKEGGAPPEEQPELAHVAGAHRVPSYALNRQHSRCVSEVWHALAVSRLPVSSAAQGMPHPDDLMVGNAGRLSDASEHVDFCDSPTAESRMARLRQRLHGWVAGASWTSASIPRARVLPLTQSGISTATLHRETASLDTTPISPVQLERAREDGVVVLELFGGICAGLEAALRNGLKVNKYLYVDHGEVPRRAARFRVQQLHARYPATFPFEASVTAFRALPQDVYLLQPHTLVHAGAKRGEQWMVVAGWECQDLSPAGSGEGLAGKRSSTFFPMLNVVGTLQRMQPMRPPIYWLENAASQHNHKHSRVRKDHEVICQRIGDPVCVDAARLGSGAHRLRNFWTNMCDSAMLDHVLQTVQRPKGVTAQQRLDPGCSVKTCLNVHPSPPYYPANTKGQPRVVMPALVARADTYSRRSGAGLIVDASDPQRPFQRMANATERERFLGYEAGATAAPGLTEEDRHALTGRCMDMQVMETLFGLSLALQCPAAACVNVCQVQQQHLLEHYGHGARFIMDQGFTPAEGLMDKPVTAAHEQGQRHRRGLGYGKPRVVSALVQQPTGAEAGGEDTHQDNQDTHHAGGTHLADLMQHQVTDFMLEHEPERAFQCGLHWLAACTDFEHQQDAVVLAAVADTTDPALADVWNDVPVMQFLRTGNTPNGTATAEQYRITRRAASYALKGEQLSRVMADGSTRMVPQPALRRQIVLTMHEQCGHYGRKRTASLVMAQYWWHGLHHSVKDVVRKCALCDRVRGSFQPSQPTLQPLPIKGMFYRWGVDLCGPFNETPRGNTYVLVAIEYFSKHVELVPIPSKHSTHTAYAMMHNVFGRFGASAEVVTDGGGEFQGDFHDMLEACLVDHRTTSANHPQANGLAERTVKTIKSALRKHLADNPESTVWDLELPWVALGYRCSVQESTGLSPYELLYGTRPVIPPAVHERMESPVNWDDSEAAVQSVLERAEAMKANMAIARGNLEIAQHRDTTRYAMVRSGAYRPKIHEFQVGDYVYLGRANPTNTLQIRTLPAVLRVIAVRPSGVLLLQGRCTRVITVHATRCTPCHLPDIDPDMNPALFQPGKDHACQVCNLTNDETNMLLCNACSAGWHRKCLSPPLKRVPNGVWVCPNCTESGVTTAEVQALESARMAAEGLTSQKAEARFLSRKEQLTAAQGKVLHGRLIKKPFKDPVTRRIRMYTGKLQYQGLQAGGAHQYLVRYTDGDQETMLLHEITAEMLLPAGTEEPEELVVAIAATDMVLEGARQRVQNCLNRYMPGAWAKKHITRLAGCLPGGPGCLTPAGTHECVPTLPEEVEVLVKLVHADRLGVCFDAWSGTGTIAEALRQQVGLQVVTNDIDTSTNAMYHEDALQLRLYDSMRTNHGVQSVVCSPWFRMLDMAAPLALAGCTKVACLHVPGHFFYDAHPIRQAWLKKLHGEGRLAVVTGLPNGPLGRRCIWLLLFVSAAMKRVILRSHTTDSALLFV